MIKQLNFPIDRTLTLTTKVCQIGTGNNVNERRFHIR